MLIVGVELAWLELDRSARRTINCADLVSSFVTNFCASNPMQQSMQQFTD
jgi:hypothetical protein